MTHVSEIHAAGGLAKWMDREARKVLPDIQEISTIELDAKKKEKKTTVPLEHEEQVNFVAWADFWLPENLRPLLFAIPNGGARHKKTAADLKAEGVRRGIPDLFFSHARLGFHGLYIEMKRISGGRLSDEQKGMIERLKSAGYAVVVCRGCEEAKAALRAYMIDTDRGFFDGEKK